MREGGGGNFDGRDHTAAIPIPVNCFPVSLASSQKYLLLMKCLFEHKTMSGSEASIVLNSNEHRNTNKTHSNTVTLKRGKEKRGDKSTQAACRQAHLKKSIYKQCHHEGNLTIMILRETSIG